MHRRALAVLQRGLLPPPRRRRATNAPRVSTAHPTQLLCRSRAAQITFSVPQGSPLQRQSRTAPLKLMTRKCVHARLVASAKMGAQRCVIRAATRRCRHPRFAFPASKEATLLVLGMRSAPIAWQGRQWPCQAQLHATDASQESIVRRTEHQGAW